MKPYYSEDGITIYHGDCREVLQSLAADVVVTDPPYGVMLGEAGTGQEKDSGRKGYTQFSDTPEYVRDVVVPAFRDARALAGRAIITPGNRNAFLYPQPDDIGVWYNPAGTGIGRWGFMLAHLIFYYGPNPEGGHAQTPSSTWAGNDPVTAYRENGHPCPKPLRFTKWLVRKASKENETVLDPFMGSGTTALVARQHRRDWLGIELNPRYIELANDRLARET